MATDQQFAELIMQLRELSVGELVLTRTILAQWIRNRQQSKLDATLATVDARRKAKRGRKTAAPAGVTDADHSDAAVAAVSHVLHMEEDITA